ncbi:MAG: amidohydrolase [Clostridiales bacterium]|jgi:amidohydrolase|nr:amidohydrolase [Clostridiales bacterium]
MIQYIENLAPELIQLRRTLHQYPELGFQEFQTAKLIEERLERLGVEDIRRVAGTGVTGIVRGSCEGKTLLLRADIDALPLTETTGADYASRNAGTAHACGHDVHTAILLGVADTLLRYRAQFRGNVKLVFQPAEEALGGALPMIEQGVMEAPAPDAAAAYHVWDLPVGTVGIRAGGVTASPDHFRITLTGKGGHGAAPETCVNPIEIGARVATRLNNLKLDTPSVVSICSFLGGTGENIIPETCLLKGTARALDGDTRRRLYEVITATAEEVAASLGGTAVVDYRFLYPPCINDSGMVERFVSAANAVIGQENVIYQKKPDMTGDDFAYFAERVPSCYVKLGGAKTPLHAPNFDVDEACIKTGVAVMCRFALDFLA